MQNKQPTLSSLEKDFLEAVHSREPVSGLTHNFYYYPARFSHLFARTAIELFTERGELVFDPFMGGGTTLVEAQYLGRKAIGADINSLAALISRVKTTPLSNADVRDIRSWFAKLPARLNLRNKPVRAVEWIKSGYQRNISGKHTWPIRKTLELALAYIHELNNVQQQEFARCVLLKTGQWAIHRCSKIPSAQEFRSQLHVYLDEMLEGVLQLSDHLLARQNLSSKPICLHCNTAFIENESVVKELPAPKLILTSPPYPGVHVLYHRWQVDGRKETPAPYWVADCLDGKGGAYYTLGSRSQAGLENYFVRTKSIYSSLAKIANPDTLLLQMVGFSNRSRQLPKYLAVLQEAGFEEVKMLRFANESDGRLWRIVPNRKWYTYRPGVAESSQEVVLFHRLA